MGLDEFWDARGELRDWSSRVADTLADRGDAARDRLRSPAEREARRETVRKALHAALGGLAPRGQVTGSTVAARDLGFCEVRRVLVRSALADDSIPATLYVPHGKGDRPGVLVSAGHYREGKAHGSVQRLAQALARAGIVALTYDPIGQGERIADTDDGRWGSWQHEYLGTASLNVGESLARQFVLDAQCALDFLASQTGGPGARLGAAGHSGGGMQTALLMMLEPRIAAAAPAHFISSDRWRRRAAIPADAEQVWPGMAEVGFDDEDILLCMAPRPVLVQAATDDFVPIEGTRATVERSRRHWRGHGGDRALSLLEYRGGHEFTDECARDAAAFFARVLDAGTPADAGAPLTVLPEDELRVLAAGHSMPSRRAHPFPALLRRRDELRAAAGTDDVEWLARKVTKHRSGELPLVTKRYAERDLGRLRAELLLWWAFEGVHGHGALVRPRARPSSVTLAVLDTGTAALDAQLPLLETACANGGAAFVIDLAGMGQLRPLPATAVAPEAVKGALQSLAHALWWIGDDLVAVRTYCVLRAVAVLDELFGERIEIEARGDACGLLYLSLARILEPRLRLPPGPSAGELVARWIERDDETSLNMHAYVMPGLLAHVR